MLYFLRLAERLKLAERMPGLTARLHIRMIALYGNAADASVQARTYFAQLVCVSCLIAAGCLSLGALSGEPLTFLCAGAVLPILFIAVRVKELDKRIRKRKMAILQELPELINKLTLLVNAGEPIQQALVRCSEETGDGAEQPLYRELEQLANELSNNVSLIKALEDFSKRCGVPEAALFTTTVLLHFRRGGEDLVLALTKLGGDLWDRRKALARTLGEEASSKLVFPMVAIFFIIMVMIAAPAIFVMNG